MRKLILPALVLATLSSPALARTGQPSFLMWCDAGRYVPGKPYTTTGFWFAMPAWIFC